MVKFLSFGCSILQQGVSTHYEIFEIVAVRRYRNDFWNKLMNLIDSKMSEFLSQTISWRQLIDYNLPLFFQFFYIFLAEIGHFHQKTTKTQVREIILGSFMSHLNEIDSNSFLKYSYSFNIFLMLDVLFWVVFKKVDILVLEYITNNCC